MKYLEGNIFVNFYIFGLAGIVAVLLGGFIYIKYGARLTYLLSFNMSIIGCIGMIVIQSKLLSFESEKQRDNFDEKFMPALILLLKMGIICSYITTT